MVSPNHNWPNRGSGPWGQANPASVPLKIGSHARPCPLTEVMDVIIGRMEKNRMRLVVNGGLYPIAIQGDPLTQPQDVHLGCGEEASQKTIIPDSDIEAVLGQNEYSAYYLSRDIRAADFDRVGSFWANAYFLSLSGHRFVSENMEGFQSGHIGSDTSKLEIPFNLATALLKHRTEKIQKLWPQISILDEYGFENHFVTMTGLPYPDPTRKPPEPEEQPEDITSLREKLGIARKSVEGGVQMLQDRIARTGNASVPVLQAYGSEVVALCTTMARVISRDQHQSDLDAAQLRQDLKRVAAINTEDLVTTFAEPLQLISLVSTLQKLESHKPTWLDRIAFWRPSVEEQKKSVKNDILKAEEEKGKAKKNKVNELQQGVTSILETTSVFQEAAQKRVAVLDGQDKLFDDVLILLDQTIETLKETSLQYDEISNERFVCNTRVEDLLELKQSMSDYNETINGLIRGEVVFSSDINKLGTRLTRTLLRIIKAEAIQRTTAFEDIASDTAKLDRDVFQVVEQVSNEFRAAIERHETQRAVLSARASLEQSPLLQLTAR